MRRRLTKQQTDTLLIILKFRYVTTLNLAISRNISTHSAYSCLENLTKYNYLTKDFNKNYFLLHKPARYFLTPEAIDYLVNQLGIPLSPEQKRMLKYASKRSIQFMDQQIAIHTSYNQLKSLYGDNISIKTAIELIQEEDMIRPLPNLLVTPTSGKSFLVELTHDQHLFLVKKRIRRYIQHYDDGDWQWSTYPDVVIVRPGSTTDRTNLRKYISDHMDSGYLDEDDFSIQVVASLKQIKLK